MRDARSTYRGAELLSDGSTSVHEQTPVELYGQLLPVYMRNNGAGVEDSVAPPVVEFDDDDVASRETGCCNGELARGAAGTSVHL